MSVRPCETAGDVEGQPVSEAHGEEFTADIEPEGEE